MTFLSEKNLVICVIIILIVLFLVYLNKKKTPYELDLINNPKVSPSVQLGAINSLLDRSGYQTITKIEDVTGRKTDAELREELKHLLSTIAVVRGPYDPSDTNGSGSIQ